jgi:hypothetical protein
LNNKLKMKRRNTILFAAIAILAFVSGCNGGVTNPMEQLNNGVLIADFPNGTGYNSAGAHVVNQSSSYYISSTQDVSGQPADEINMTIPIPLNFNLPYTVTASDGVDIVYLDALTNNNYEANAAQGSCSVTITQVSPTVEGYFTATAICSSISDNTRVLTGGQFNATF